MKKEQVINYVKPNLGLNIRTLMRLFVVLLSWGLHQSVIKSLLGLIFPLLYLIYWALFGSTSNEQGILQAYNYYFK